jgi:preprotein translocase subunit YajC
MIDTAYAMAPPQSGGQQTASPISGFLPLILIFFVFYFLLIRPQKKQMQDQQKMINSIKKGDRIVTSGGMHGKVTALKGKQLELEIASNTKVIINRQAVSSKQEDNMEESDGKGEKKE